MILRHVALLILIIAMASLASEPALDSNGMSVLNHARYSMDNCEQFTELKNSGQKEYDYIEQILAGKTSHPQRDIARIKYIRERYAALSSQLKSARKFQFRRTIDLLKTLGNCPDCDPPFTEEFYELTAFYQKESLIKIEWIRNTNWPTRDTASAYFDETGSLLFLFRRTTENNSTEHRRYYYDERRSTIAATLRSEFGSRDCESKQVPLDLMKNYPYTVDRNDDPLDELRKLDEMVCTAKNMANCDYFNLKRRGRR